LLLLRLADRSLSREEFERLAALKMPLVQVRGQWVLLQPDQIEAAIAFWEKKRKRAEMPLRDALGLALGASGKSKGCLYTASRPPAGWMSCWRSCGPATAWNP
jgi:hypothetical protein